MPGLLIAFEGIDQSGKATQASLLENTLRSAGINVGRASFPDYSGPIGELLSEYLQRGREFNLTARQLLYAADRWEASDKIAAQLAAGSTVILDRYVASGIAYGVAQGLQRHFCEALEHGLPSPQLTFFLDISLEAAFARKIGERDRYEQSHDLLAAAKKEFERLSEHPSWFRIDALRSPSDISSDVVSCLARRGFLSVKT